jgi:two-component system sensor histidine kinase FlrB
MPYNSFIKLIEDINQQHPNLDHIFYQELLNQTLHEINNKVQSLYLTIELSNNNKNLAEKYLPKALKQADELLNYLNFVRNFKHYIKPRKEIINLNCLVEETIDYLRPSFDARSIEIELIKKEDPINVLVNSLLLKDAYINLFTNSREAIKKNGKITIENYLMENYAISKLRDTGPGINEQNIEKIFEKYYSTKEDGSGLGLYITQSLIKSFGGDIKAVANPSGAEFILRLPIIQK